MEWLSGPSGSRSIYYNWTSFGYVPLWRIRLNPFLGCASGEEGGYRIKGEWWVSIIEYVRLYILKKKLILLSHHAQSIEFNLFVNGGKSRHHGNHVNKLRSNPVSRLITSSEANEFHIEFLPKRSLRILQWISREREREGMSPVQRILSLESLRGKEESVWKWNRKWKRASIRKNWISSRHNSRNDEWKGI